MKILHVNKFLYRRGGAEAYMEDVAALQAQAGHEIAFFAMEHPQNRPSAFSAHFPPHLELDPPPASLAGKAKGIGRMLYSGAARRGIDEVLEAFEPDVVHLHNVYHHLSPSILKPPERRGIPVVMTLHDYKLACPTYRFLDHGKVCEACLGGRFHHAILRRCNQGSLGASAVSAAELFLHTLSRAYDPVRLFICPSRFIAQKMAAAGVFPQRLRWVNHFVETTTVKTKERPGGPILYAGRLSYEKGVDTLIEAVGQLGPDVRLEIAGDGPELARLKALADQAAPQRVTFHGRLPKDKLEECFRSAAVLAVPSRWYENQPLIVLEAFACSLPVIATDLGGIPELINPGVDGALVPPNDATAWAAALRPLLENPAAAFSMGKAGRAKVEDQFSPARHLANLEELYEEASSRVSARA